MNREKAGIQPNRFFFKSFRIEIFFTLKLDAAKLQKIQLKYSNRALNVLRPPLRARR